MGTRLSDDEIIKKFSKEPKHDDRTLNHYVLKYPHLKDSILELATDMFLEKNTVSNVVDFKDRRKTKR